MHLSEVHYSSEHIFFYQSQVFIELVAHREELDPTIRWRDRLQSSSGEWSGNVCDFYFRVYNKIIKDIKVPFKMVGGERIDDTSVHKALREALANCLINADYHGLRGVVIRKEPDKLILAYGQYGQVGVDGVWRDKEKDCKKTDDKKRR